MAGCFQTKDLALENVYEGMYNREQIVNPANEPSQTEHQSYDQYKKEREELLKKNSE